MLTKETLVRRYAEMVREDKILEEMLSSTGTILIKINVMMATRELEMDAMRNAELKEDGIALVALKQPLMSVHLSVEIGLIMIENFVMMEMF
jgi:urease gamma subunit